MDISILLNKTVTNLWDKTQVQQIKTIIGASQALVGRAALPWGLRGGAEPSPDLSWVSGWRDHRAALGAAAGGQGAGPTGALEGQLSGGLQRQLPLRDPWGPGEGGETQSRCGPPNTNAPSPAAPGSSPPRWMSADPHTVDRREAQPSCGQARLPR